MNNQNKFIEALRYITGVSEQYADTAWYTLNDNGKKSPTLSARNYAKRFNLKILNSTIEKMIMYHVRECTNRKAIRTPGNYENILNDKTSATWGWAEPLRYNGYLIVISQPSPTHKDTEPVAFYDYIADTDKPA